jgi:hypothetical protein
MRRSAGSSAQGRLQYFEIEDLSGQADLQRLGECLLFNVGAAVFDGRMQLCVADSLADLDKVSRAGPSPPEKNPDWKKNNAFHLDLIHSHELAG